MWMLVSTWMHRLTKDDRLEGLESRGTRVPSKVEKVVQKRKNLNNWAAKTDAKDAMN